MHGMVRRIGASRLQLHSSNYTDNSAPRMSEIYYILYNILYIYMYQYVRGILKNSNLVGVGGGERTPLGPSIRPFPTVSVYEHSNSHA
eukprot:SAG31_NODE_661_length_13035_cov_12.057591_6_plen_88_part_00